MKKQSLLWVLMIGGVLAGCASSASYNIKRPALFPGNKVLYIPSGDKAMTSSLRREFVRHGWRLSSQSKAKYIANVSLTYKSSANAVKCYDKGRYISDFQIEVLDKSGDQSVFSFVSHDACEKQIIHKLGESLK